MYQSSWNNLGLASSRGIKDGVNLCYRPTFSLGLEDIQSKRPLTTLGKHDSIGETAHCFQLAFNGVREMLDFSEQNTAYSVFTSCVSLNTFSVSLTILSVERALTPINKNIHSAPDLGSNTI